LTTFPSKDPIIGVDVTADGKWVLATCKTYLIVINTEIKDTGVTGFAKSMGQNKVAFPLSFSSFFFRSSK